MRTRGRMGYISTSHWRSRTRPEWEWDTFEHLTRLWIYLECLIGRGIERDRSMYEHLAEDRGQQDMSEKETHSNIWLDIEYNWSILLEEESREIRLQWMEWTKTRVRMRHLRGHWISRGHRRRKDGNLGYVGTSHWRFRTRRTEWERDAIGHLTRHWE